MKKIGIVAAVTLCAALFSGCGVVAREVYKANSNAISRAAESAAAESAKIEEAAAVTYHIGDTITTEKWEITINSFSTEEKIQNSQYTAFTPDEGNKYVVANLTVKNTSKEAARFMYTYDFDDKWSAKIMYRDYEFAGSRLLGYDEDLHDTQLNPLTSKTGVLVFSVASDVADKLDELTFAIAEGKMTYNVACGGGEAPAESTENSAETAEI